MSLTPGTRLGSYSIVGLLGAGGMGEVYRATDTRLGRDVALKLLPAELAADAEFLARFQREARALAALDHPGIVTVHSVEEEGGTHFLTMQLVEGRSLAALLETGPIPPDRLIAIAAKLAEALAAAHEKDIIHRDLKPANVMVTSDGRVKVVDFGLARHGAGGASGTRPALTTIALTGTGVVMGTAPYMSPEQVTDAPLDARSDLFSFGAVLYEMATGRRAFEGGTHAELSAAILRDEPKPLSALRRDLPPGLAAIVARCLAKDRAARPATAREVAADLRALADGRPLRTSSSRTKVALAAAALAFVAVIAVVTLRSRPAPPAPPVPPPGDAARMSIAMLPFENVSGDPSLDWMERGVPELVSAALVQSEALDVFDAQRLDELAATDRSARRATGATAPPGYAFLAGHGIRRAIAGTILRSGPVLRLQGRVVDTADGRLVRSYAVEGPADSGLFNLVGRMIPDLQVALEVSLAGNREAEGWLRDITTTSVDAYRNYLRGHEAMLASRWKEAASAYEQALTLDSTFIAARTELSGAYWNLGDMPRLQLTRAAMQRLRHRADHRGRLRIDLLESVVGDDPSRLVPTATELVELYPENRFYRYLLGRGHFVAGDYRRCIDTLQPLVDQRYGWAWTYVLTARSAAQLGDTTAARRAFDLGLEVSAAEPEMAYAYIQFLEARGDRARSREVVAKALESPSLSESPVGEGEVRLVRARHLAEEGDVTAARRELTRSLALLPRVDEAWPAADSLRRQLGLH